MNHKLIEFKKKRELGDILSDTFTFIRINIKPLFRVLIKTAGIPFLILLGAVVYYTAATGDLMNPENIRNGDIFTSGNMILSLFLLGISAMAFYGLLFGTVLNYIKVYVEHHGEVQEELVQQGVKNDFGGIIGLAILAGLIVGTGLLFCIIPGVYLYVPMSLVFTVMVFRNKGISDSISESFALVKNEWWMTFATLFIINLLVSVIGMVFSIPTLIYTFANGIISAQQGTMGDPSEVIDWVFIIMNTISTAAKYILYIVTAIATAFIYYNLNERKNLTGTFEKIDSLGKTE